MIVDVRAAPRHAAGNPQAAPAPSVPGLPPDAAGGDALSLRAECGLHADPASREVARDLCARFGVEAGVLGDVAAAQSLPGGRPADAAPQGVREVTGGAVPPQRGHPLCSALPPWSRSPTGTVIGGNDGEPVAS